MVINSLICEKNEIWLTSSEYPILICGDIYTKKMKVHSFLDCESKDALTYYGVSTKAHDKIYIAPLNGNHLCIYNIKTKELKKIELNEKYKKYPFKYRQVVCYEKDIYFVGCTIPNILKVDTATDCVYEIELYEIDPTEEEIWQRFFAKTHDNKLLLSDSNTGEIIEFDLVSNQMRKYNFTNRVFDGTCVVGNKLYGFILDENYFYEYDLGNCKEKRIKFPEDFCVGKRSFGNVEIFDKDLVMIPFHANVLFRYDTVSGSFKYLKKWENSETKYLFSGKFCEDKIWGFLKEKQSVELIDIHSGESQLSFYDEVEGVEKARDIYIRNSSIMVENNIDGIGLKDLIRFVEHA